MKVSDVDGNEAQSPAVAFGMLDLVGRAALLVALGALAGVGVNMVRPDGLAVSSFRPPVACGEGDGVPGEGPEVHLVSQREATALCAEPDTLIADVRSARAFAEGHVSGAIHLPCNASERTASAAEHGLSGKRLLLVYGDGTDDALPVAEQMRRRLGRADLTIRVLDGGFAAWSAAGLACTSGECPACGAPGHGHGGQAE